MKNNFCKIALPAILISLALFACSEKKEPPVIDVVGDLNTRDVTFTVVVKNDQPIDPSSENILVEIFLTNNEPELIQVEESFYFPAIKDPDGKQFDIDSRDVDFEVSIVPIAGGATYSTVINLSEYQYLSVDNMLFEWDKPGTYQVRIFSFGIFTDWIAFEVIV